MKREEIDRILTLTLMKVKGIIEVKPLLDGDREEILAIEKKAEERSLMGLGRVVNTGIYEIFNCNYVYIALTSIDMDWGSHPSLVLKKGQEIVGEEVRDMKDKKELQTKKDVWFMLDNFIIYKDKINFPQDLVKKICHFETPPLPADWCNIDEGQLNSQSMIYANPVSPSDIFLKTKYFDGINEQGLGTILVGIQLK